jgi:hypothetical protein
MRLRRAACAFALSSVVVLASSSARARAGDPAAAREQVKLGYMLAQDGKCEEAIPHFVESLRLDVKAITLINLAACEEKTGKLADALGHWVEARGRAQAEGNAAIEEEAEKKTKALEDHVPKLTVVVRGAPPDAEVVRDGVALGAASMGVPLPVNAGPHRLVVRVKGHEDRTESVTVAEGETKRVELQVGPPASAVAVAPRAPTTDRGGRDGAGTSPLVYVGFGAAIAGVAVGSITGVMAFGKASTASDECPNTVDCSPAGKDAVDSGRSLGTISTIGFVVAGVGAAVGVYGLVWGKPSSSTSVAVSFGPMGGGLRGTF